MANIYDVLTKINGRNVNIFKHGYEEAPEAALLLYNMEDLNSEKFDFQGQRIRQIKSKLDLLAGPDYIEWNNENLKEATTTISNFVNATTFDVGFNNVRIGETWRNMITGAVVVVQNVVGSTVTLLGAGDPNAANGQTIKRMSYAKRYGLQEGFEKERNDLDTEDNYVTVTQYNLASDLFENNQLRLFLDTQNQGNEAEIVDFVTAQYADYSRKIVADSLRSYFITPKTKQASGGSFIRMAGGVESYIQPQNLNVNIRGIDDSETKVNLRLQLTKAYKSGLKGIMGDKKLLAFATTSMIAKIDHLYEGKVIYNDVLKGVNIKISTYRVGPYELNLVHSSILNDIYDTGEMVMYFIPIDYSYLYMLPNDASRGMSAKSQESMQGMGRVMKLPQVVGEKVDYIFYTAYSFVYGGNTTDAYQKIIYA